MPIPPEPEMDSPDSPVEVAAGKIIIACSPYLFKSSFCLFKTAISSASLFKSPCTL